MRKLCYKKWVKAIAAVLFLLSLNAMALSFFAMAVCAGEGVYDRKIEETREDWQQTVQLRYTVTALADYQNAFGVSELKDTNFLYAVRKKEAEDPTEFSRDPAMYEVWNLDADAEEDGLTLHSYVIGEQTEFITADSAFDAAYLYNEPEVLTARAFIEALYYVWDADAVFAKAGESFYQVSFYTSDAPLQAQIKEAGYESGGAVFQWTDPNLRIRVEEAAFTAAEIPILSQSELEALGDVYMAEEQDGDGEYVIEGDSVAISYLSEEGCTYDVFSCVRSPLKTNGAFWDLSFFGKIAAWEKQDFFVQAEWALRILYTIRYPAFICFWMFLALTAATFFVLMTGAGRRKDGTIAARVWERIPADVWCVLTIIILACIPVAVSEGRYSRLTILFGILYALAGEIAFLWFCMSMAVRIKIGSLWKNTVCYRVPARLMRLCRRTLQTFDRTFPMLWKAWSVMAALALLELIGLSMSAYSPRMQILLWFTEKALLYAFLTKRFLQMKKLQDAAGALAEGKMDGRLETENMFGEFRRHGESLNHIQDGIRIAVEEQLKSERFKTELITNVSHDIRTPLTSIINYVDLMEKENIESPVLKEYLEVLSRQSARLKKLIEDLMEASKASTGNLAVAWEPCDANIMLTQTVGEFEEKLKAAQIELIVMCGEPSVIQADPRHLWRIFENLMNNICKYALPTSRAYVNIEKEDGFARIVFRNISRYALHIDSAELTERFVRGDSSRNTEGSGLGLSIAQSLTELMQGRFELSVDGDLFKVTLSFPEAQAD